MNIPAQATQQAETAAIPSFSDLLASRAPEPIRHGSAIVPWAPACKGIAAGWALPGGSRTSNPDTARAVAHNIHAAMQEQAQRIAANQRSAA